MLYYDRIDLSEGNDPAKTKKKMYGLSLIAFLIKGLNFRITFVMIVMI